VVIPWLAVAESAVSSYRGGAVVLHGQAPLGPALSRTMACNMQVVLRLPGIIQVYGPLSVKAIGARSRKGGRRVNKAEALRLLRSLHPNVWADVKGYAHRRPYL